MNSLKSIIHLCACATISIGMIATVEAKPGKGKGGDHGKSEAHGKGDGKDKGQGQKAHDKPDKPDKVVKKLWNDDARKAARFRDDDRVIVLRYFDGFRGEPHGLPPGLAKKLARGKPLPPGWQKKLAPGYVIEPAWWDDFQPVEPEWFPGMRAMPDSGLYWYGDRIVRVHRPSREIIDVIPVPTIRPDW